MTSLDRLAAELKSAGLLAEPPPRGAKRVELTGIRLDSRELEPGELYCAIRGFRDDGHDYLHDAARAGAAAALVEAPAPGIEIPQIRVSDDRRAAAVAAQHLFGWPGRQLRLIGVTGTNGKTTTVHITRHLLGGREAAGSLGTLGMYTPDGERRPLELTTPDPVEFARRLAELRDAGAGWVVVEVSSHALDQERVAGVRFTVAVFTNISRDHLDYHGDFQDYRASKARLAGLLADDGVLVVNADEPVWRGLQADGPGTRRVRYGLEAEADYSARDVRLEPEGSSWTLTAPDGEAAVRTPLVGGFNVANALAAAATVGALGWSCRDIAGALGSLPPVPGRLEQLGDAPLILRDYAHTPDALRSALAAVRPLTAGRVILVFGCGGDRDPGKRPAMGRAAAEGADLVIVTSDNPRTEPPGTIIDDIVPGLEGASYERIESRREAIARALELADPDDLVLLAGKGHESYQVIGEERRPFDEAAIVAELRSGSRDGP